MPKESIWESNQWKIIVAISILLGILVSVITILQVLGKVNLWNSVILPISTFFGFPVPLFSIPLTVLILFVILVLYARAGGDVSITFEGAEILDDEYVRYLAILSKTPQTADFLKQKHKELHDHNRAYGGYSSEDALKIMEKRGLMIFENGHWKVTQKALDYMNKFHGEAEGDY